MQILVESIYDALHLTTNSSDTAH